MRFARIITVSVAFALIGFLPFTSSATAAKPTTTSAAAQPMVAKSPMAARTERQISIKIVKKYGKLILVGGVKPPKGPMIIQKATNCNVKAGTCNFKFYRKVPVKQGRFQARVYAPRSGSWAWRARVGTSASKVWVTCTRANPTAACPTP